MNKVILIGRLVRDAEIRYTQGEEQKCIARFTLAVDRRVKRDSQSNQQTADFISCIAFGKAAEFYERFGKRGVKFAVEGKIQTGSYEKDGSKVYTTTVVVENTEFSESKSSSQPEIPPVESDSGDGFMSIPDGIDEELPFN